MKVSSTVASFLNIMLNCKLLLLLLWPKITDKVQNQPRYREYTNSFISSGNGISIFNLFTQRVRSYYDFFFLISVGFG